VLVNGGCRAYILNLSFSEVRFVTVMKLIVEEPLYLNQQLPVFRHFISECCTVDESASQK
jgi:hypothetical protein